MQTLTMIDTETGEALHRLLHTYKRAMRQAYREAGISLPISHIRALKIIRSQQHSAAEPCTAQMIAARLERDKAQIARVVKELLGDGLIARYHHPDDRRSQILQLTDPGAETLGKVKTAETLAGKRMARGLSEDELETFIRLAGVMTNNLSP